MIDWSAGYSSEWRVYRVATDTWADAEEIDGVTECRVERSGDGDAPTLESGTLSVDMGPLDEFAEGYVRIVMVAAQGAESERVDVATLLAQATGADVDRGVASTEVTCRSVLWPASVTLMESGSYAPMGADGVAWAADVLSGCVNAPVTSTGSFALEQHVVFDSGTSALAAAWQVLKAGGHTIQIGGDGTVTLLPLPTEPALELSWADARLLHPGVHRDLSLADVPNRYRAVEGSEEAVAVNDDPTSETSTVTRGWVHDAPLDTSPLRVGGETLAAYCARRLEEESTVSDERSYGREWWPGVVPGSVVRGSLATAGIDGDLRVMRQTVTCSHGLVVEETADREVRTWQRA